jgi:L-lactate permease
VPALMGSLVLVALIRKAESPGSSPAYIIGYNLSDWLAEGFVAISALLGTLGSFFSGSTTVSNLTFGSIQQARLSLSLSSDTWVDRCRRLLRLRFCTAPAPGAVQKRHDHAPTSSRTNC